MNLRQPLLLASCMLVSVLVAQDPQVEARPTTTLEFNAMEHDFGDIYQGSENPYVFRFKNTGSVPLVIENAKGSCGCTVPFYAKDPIMPGEESEIHVVYKPGKQEGQQTKSVTLMANTEMGTTILRIKANVLVVDSVVAPTLFAIEEEHVNKRLQRLLADPNNQLKVDDASKIVGCWKALAKQGLREYGNYTGPMRRAVAFCQVIKPTTVNANINNLGATEQIR